MARYSCHAALFHAAGHATGDHRFRQPRGVIPLSQAAQGSYDGTGANLFFTRLPFQGSYAKRYQGGMRRRSGSTRRAAKPPR